MNKLILAFAIILLGAGEAVAVDLINRDSRDYDVKIVTSNGSSYFISIGGRSSRSDICSSSCTIHLGESSPVTASGNETVFIVDGRLNKK